MALTQISTGGVKDDAVTAGKIPANAVGSSEIADDAVDQGAIADEAVDEARLQISNAGSNGQFLQKQSGNTGGLTWAAANEYTHPNHSGEVTSTADGAQVIASNIVDEDNLKISNAGTNGQYLQKQSGNTGGLTWADVTIPPSGNTVELVADGAIAAGKAVQLKTNGKIEEIKETVAESNIAAKVDNNGIEDTTTGQNYLAYDPTNRYVLHTWQSNESGVEYSNYRLYTINANGATMSSSGSDQRLVSSSASSQPQHVRCGFDTNRGKFLIINGKDRSSSNQKTSYVGTVSGTSVTWSNKTVFDTNTTETNKLELVYDTTNNMFIAFYAYYNSGLNCNAGTMNSSGEMTWAGAQTVQSGSFNAIEVISAAYDSTTNRIVTIWRLENGSARSGHMKVGRKSTSDNTITWGDSSEWHGQDWDLAGLACGNGKVVVVFNDKNDSRKLKYKVGTLSSSDNTVSWGSTTATGLTDHCFNVDLCYQPNIDKFLISYTVSPNGTTEQNGDDSKIAKGEVSGTSMTWSNATTYDGNSNRGLNIIPLGGTLGSSFAAFAHTGLAANDSTKNKFYIQHAATATSNQYEGGKRFIGFTPSAISDGAAGTVNTDGNTIDNQSGLTAGTRYYVQDSGALGTGTSSGSGVTLRGGGLALSASKVLIRYKDE